MIVAVDSNILLSIFSKDSLYPSASALLTKFHYFDYVINEYIYLELGVHFSDLEELDQNLDTLEIRVLSQYQLDHSIIVKAWKAYLKKREFFCPFCKKAILPICSQCHNQVTFRQRILTDFIIAGFALAVGDGIITLDPAYYSTHFPRLKIYC